MQYATKTKGGFFLFAPIVLNGVGFISYSEKKTALNSGTLEKLKTFSAGLQTT
jgi:hypothetical protein